MKTYFKSILRMIKSNLSRFITIILIVMLGVGFLVGLFSVSPDLEITTNNFLKQQQTSEVYFTSMTGFLENDVKAFEEGLEAKGLKSIRATYESDEYITISGEKSATRLVYQDFTSTQDVLKLIDGKMPTKTNEVLVEQSGKYVEAPSIGTKITINEKEYEVCGIVANPWYMSKERYTSYTLNTGLKHIIYLPLSELYDPDYAGVEQRLYTNIYCYFDIDASFFSSEFKKEVNEIVEASKGLGVEISHLKNFKTYLIDQMLIKVFTGEMTIEIPESSSPIIKLLFEYIKNNPMSENEAKALLYSSEDIHRMIVKSIENDEEINKMIEEQMQAIEELNQFIYLSRLDSFDMVMFDTYLSKVEAVSYVFPVFFFIIAMLVTLTSIQRLIKEERNTIGTLRGIGYSKWLVSLRYYAFSLVAAGIGCLLGIALGIALIPKVVYDTYLTNCHLPPLIYAYNTNFITIAVFVMLIITALVTFLTLKKILKENPASILVPTAPLVGRRILLEKVTFIWKHLKFKYKSTIRNMIRYRRNMIMMLIGIGGCAALVFLAFGIQNSLSVIGNRQFESIIRYDMFAYANNPTSLDDERISESMPIYYDEYSLEGGYTVKVIASDSDLNEYIGFYDLKQKPMSFDSNSVFISHQIAKEFKLGIGEQIVYDDYNYTITGIFENYVDNYLIIGSEVNNLTNNGYLIKSNNLSYDELNTLGQDLVSNGQITAADYVYTVASSYTSLLDSIGLIVLVIIIFAAILAFIVIFNLININVDEREREIATLKVLGYHTREVHGYIARETFLLTIIGILCGIGVGYGLTRFIAMIIDSAGLMAGRIVNWTTYLYTSLITLSFAIIVDICFIPHYRKISMIDSLKAVE